MSKKETVITIAMIKDGLNAIFPSSIKKLDLEEDEEKNYFFFELQFIEDVNELITPDGIFIGSVDFNERFIEGVIDGVAFLEFVKENK